MTDAGTATVTTAGRCVSSSPVLLPPAQVLWSGPTSAAPAVKVQPSDNTTPHTRPLPLDIDTLVPHGLGREAVYTTPDPSDKTISFAKDHILGTFYLKGKV